MKSLAAVMLGACIGTLLASSYTARAQTFRRHPGEWCWMENQFYPDYIVTNDSQNISLANGINWVNVRMTNAAEEPRRWFCPVLSDDLANHSTETSVTVDFGASISGTTVSISACADEALGLFGDCETIVSSATLGGGGTSLTGTTSLWAAPSVAADYPYLLIVMPPKEEAHLTGYRIGE